MLRRLARPLLCLWLFGMLPSHITICDDIPPIPTNVSASELSRIQDRSSPNTNHTPIANTSNSCSPLPLTPELWKELKLDEYLRTYPSGDSMSLEVTFPFLNSLALVFQHARFHIRCCDELTFKKINRMSVLITCLL